ncbi:MAG: DNA repair protein RecN [Pseudoflavonifractor sp.]|nr:DNA repair protein RecN [Pseudoflavonifractor sp.]
MLEHLHISNYALIDNIDIDFHPGFNIITGETGAGKSIMLGALSLLMGGRADTKVVRDAGLKSMIEAEFVVTGYTHLKDYCTQNDIEWDDERCILRREITPAGRSRAFVNDSPVSLTQLQGVAVQLVDIHSQHQNQLLSSPEYQLRIIDALADNGTLLTEYADQYNRYRKALRELHDTRQMMDRGRADEDFLRFQLEQLEEANLVTDEQEDLERDRELLANMTDIKENLYDSLQALQDGNHNALSLLSDAADGIANLSDVIDEADELSERLESARIEIQDIAETLEAYDRDMAADPDELDRVEDRLNLLYTLQRKHKVDSVEALIALRDSLRSRLDALDNSDMTIEELETAVKKTRAKAMKTAQTISARRIKEAARFAADLKERALPLGMKNLRCEISVTKGDLSETGIDRVEFLFAFNKNQPLLPVGGTASGGEISRLMLSIKSIIASKMQLPSIIFDEIDTGVSGDVANRMGEMMHSISSSLQVMAITHLPQVAAKGASHFKVFKEDDDESTRTRVKELTPSERVDELALMLSGDPTNEAARANARELLSKK